MTIAYEYGKALYVNLTNRCPCDCVFCLRQQGEGVNEGQSLWLEREPTAHEVEAALEAFDLRRYDEVVFCGYGEPCLRLDLLCHTARWLRMTYAPIPIRLNTNGLADLVYGKSTVPWLVGLIDCVSISLNAPDAATYNTLCKPVFGERAFEALLHFALDCKENIPETVMSVVAHTLSPEDLTRCKTLCDEMGLPLRIRKTQ